MFSASEKMDFNSMLAGYLRDLKYNAHIVNSDIINTARGPNNFYYSCVEVGFPKPSLKIICINDKCLWKSNDKPAKWENVNVGSLRAGSWIQRAAPRIDNWEFIGDLHHPLLVQTIEEIIKNQASKV